jgi:hypothetical protein
MSPMQVCITPGKKNARRHAVKLVAWKLAMRAMRPVRVSCKKCRNSKAETQTLITSPKILRMYLFFINWYTRGMINWVAPPPKLPQPAANPFAVPTILLLNMELIQNWHDTNVASENPMKNRTVMNPEMELTVAMEYTAGEMIITRNAHPYRGPIKSHTVPINRRDKIEPAMAKPTTTSHSEKSLPNRNSPQQNTDQSTTKFHKD